MKWVLAIQLLDFISDKFRSDEDVKELRSVIIDLKKFANDQANYISLLKEENRELHKLIEHTLSENQ